MPKGKIPDRWIPYEACGKVIEGTRIICFKVPLHKRVQKGAEGLNKIWDIPTLLSEIPTLAAVIDLTNTAKYYDPADFKAANVKHRKIAMAGRQIPPERQVQVFMDTVEEFLGSDGDSVIGVHCTHGLNRTGYMVCRYMVARLNIPAQEAIKRFEAARGYKIERQNYVAKLLGTKVPNADLGKNTVIKKIDSETNCVESETFEDGYDRRADKQNNGRYDFKNWRQRVSNTSAATANNGYTRNSGNEYLSWRKRGESSNSATPAMCQGSPKKRHSTRSDRDMSYRDSPQTRYESRPQRDEMYGRNPRKKSHWSRSGRDGHSSNSSNNQDHGSPYNYAYDY